MIINKLFEDEIRRVVGEEEYATLQEKRAYRGALRDFDIYIKPGFRGKRDRNTYVSFHNAGLKDNKPEGLQNNTMTLTG
jgi:hypothetical protein